MDRIVIQGGHALQGKVAVSGAKNSVLPIMAAALLTDEEVVIRNVPKLRDVATQCRILEALGARVLHDDANGVLRIRSDNEDPITAPYELVKTMRASICVLGPLVARRKRGRVSLPGGCVIGVRPIDLHLKGLKALGAHLEIKGGYVEAQADRLKGATLFLGSHFGSTVLGTANILMAAVLAEGETLIESAAQEPEVVDLCHCLQSMGADIRGVGTHCLRVRGVDRLHGTDHTVIPDRIEAGTFLIGAAMTGGDVEVGGARANDLLALVECLRHAGAELTIHPGGIRVQGPERCRAQDIATHAYPGFPTDLQAQMVALLCRADGNSMVRENIYPDRFIHVAELQRMGAEVRKVGPTCMINGVERLSGAPIMASDLRGSAALVLAGLVAEGETEVQRVYHIDRGYVRIDEKLRGLGATIERVSDRTEGAGDVAEPPLQAMGRAAGGA